MFSRFSFIFPIYIGIVFAESNVDTEWMRSALQNHFSQPRHHAMNPGYKAEAKAFILNEFKSYGLETYIHTFDTNVTEVKGHNVIGISKGKFFKQPEDRIVGVAAHYDTMRNSPGVDDNGAGVVIMLQAAKHLAKFSRDFTVIFVSFDFEEYESGVPYVACGGQYKLCGSKSFLSNWMASFWPSPPNITGFIVMDTMMNIDEETDSQTIPPGFDQLFPDAVDSVISDGKKGDFLAAIGRPFDTEVLAAFVSSYSALDQPEFELEKLNITLLTSPNITEEDFKLFYHLMRSDHYNFWVSGLPAIFLTDTSNFRGYMSLCYHQSCDQMNRVTNKMMKFAGKTTQAVIDTVTKLAPSTGQISGAGLPQSLWYLLVLTGPFFHTIL